jgi:hypothetical protein
MAEWSGFSTDGLSPREHGWSSGEGLLSKRWINLVKVTVRRSVFSAGLLNFDQLHQVPPCPHYQPKTIGGHNRRWINGSILILSIDTSCAITLSVPFELLRVPHKKLSQKSV